MNNQIVLDYDKKLTELNIEHSFISKSLLTQLDDLFKESLHLEYQKDKLENLHAKILDQKLLLYVPHQILHEYNCLIFL